MKNCTKSLAYSSVLAAIAVIFAFFIRFPIFPSAPFLEYDLGDVPLFIGAVMLGPWTGLLLTAVTCILQGLFVSSQNGIIGIIMHFIASGSFVLVAGLISKEKKTGRIIAAYVCGMVTWILIMIPLNLIFTPAFFMSGNYFEIICADTVEVIKALTAFPVGIKAVFVGAVTASAFIICSITAGVLTYDKRAASRAKKVNTGRFIGGVIISLFIAMLVMLLMNLIFSDIKFSSRIESVYNYMFTVLIPFNAIKAGINSIIACVLYILIGKRTALL